LKRVRSSLAWYSWIFIRIFAPMWQVVHQVSEKVADTRKGVNRH
jgi:hypothetical protein